MRYRVATITSVPLIAPEEDGQFILHVDVEEAALKASGDPAGYVSKTLAEHLAQCVSSTGLPLHNELWEISFTKWTQNHFNYPEGITL